MQRKNLFRTIIILFALVLSGMALYPTFELSQLKNRSEARYQAIIENTSLTYNDVTAALKTANLELEVREKFQATNGKSLDDILQDVRALQQLYEKTEDVEPRSIKLGLDLQGGSYLVYEVDLPQLLRNSSKVQDQKFEAVLQQTVDRVRDSGDDFFDVLQGVFQENELRLNRYFGHPRDSEEEILADLNAKAEDAINRILEVLRNRIDQFGVSEPTLTKQGGQRIVIELAGIQDVERAKNLIGTTALLEFQLEKEPEVINAVLDDIDRVVKRQMSTNGDLFQGDSATAEGATAMEKLRKDTEVDFNEVFGEASADHDSIAGETDTSSTVLIDQEVFEDRPFAALLAQVRGDIAVPVKNRKQVERILNSPEVQAVIPRDAEFLFMNKSVPAGGQDYYMLYMLKRDPELEGAMIETASADIGSDMEAGRWIVNMNLTGEGASIFSRVTGANVGRRLAIVLDGKIVSIPTIQDRIPNGRARITGMADSEEANDLAIVLRAGALEAPVEVIEERTVGPSLGEDSVQKGVLSALVGGLFVLLFMIVYYRLSGIVANIALFMNIVIIMAVLAGFHFTLTLPGIAGIILTIGMAVDANVLIFERIREELRNGKTVRAAIDGGYGRAFKTILDANVTTLLTALVLYQFGTGPIKGFALTLSIGIATSMFTAIVVTRVIFDFVTNRRAVAKLSI